LQGLGIENDLLLVYHQHRLSIVTELHIGSKHKHTAKIKFIRMRFDSAKRLWATPEIFVTQVNFYWNLGVPNAQTLRTFSLGRIAVRVYQIFSYCNL